MRFGWYSNRSFRGRYPSNPLLDGTMLISIGIGLILVAFSADTTLIKVICIIFGGLLSIMGVGRIGPYIRKTKVSKKSDFDHLYWKCKRCKTENTAQHIECWKCGKRKPGI